MKKPDKTLNRELVRTKLTLLGLFPIGDEYIWQIEPENTETNIHNSVIIMEYYPTVIFQYTTYAKDNIDDLYSAIIKFKTHEKNKTNKSD